MSTLAVAIPAYNQGAYLRATLDSVLDQTVPFDEIVVSNNHSTDETAAVLDEFADRVTIVSPPQHLPMSAHWNYVFGQVQSDWCVLLSSDDIAKPVYSEVIRRGFARRSDAVYVRAALDRIDEFGARTDRVYLMSIPRVMEPPETFFHLLDGQKAWVSASAMKICAWREVGGFPEECELLADWGLWLQLSSLGSFIYEPKVVVEYRVGHQLPLHYRDIVRWVADEAAIRLRVAPAAASRLGVDPTDVRIVAASERRLEIVASSISRYVSNETRQAAVAALRPWAEQLERHEIIETLERGAPFQLRRSWTAWARQAAKLPARRLYTWSKAS